MEYELNGFYNVDCLEAMKEFPDGYFELAVVDPPYGIGDRLVEGGHKKNPMEKYRNSYNDKKWDVIPNGEYFKELFRVSKNQIIWGGNYFDLPPSRGFVVWDKKQFLHTFSRCEYAWVSFDRPSKIFEYLQHDKYRFHPTQKPVSLYQWLLENYAKPGDKILDTHVGSASSLIACYQMGYDYIGFEIDKEYYEKASKRLELAKAQKVMF